MCLIVDDLGIHMKEKWKNDVEIIYILTRIIPKHVV